MRIPSRRRTGAALLCAVLLLSMAGCGGEQRHTHTWYAWFDTVTTVIGYGSERDFQKACDIVSDVLERYHRSCDIYHEYSGVQNARTLNLRAGEAPVSVEPELMEVLLFGREAHALTGGMCNIAMGAVLSLWHDCREAAETGEARLPDDAALRRAAEHCRMEDLHLDPAAGTAQLSDREMSVDLGAVAKGYAAEQAARALEAAGCTGYALSVGGNVRTVGVRGDGQPWVSGIEDPREESESAYLLRLALSGQALVTSGSYQRYYTVDGVRYHHIISPETLYPKNDFLSVTILCPDSALADALSTAVFNMELESGIDYVNSLESTEACWILPDGSIRMTPGLEQYVLP